MYEVYWKPNLDFLSAFTVRQVTVHNGLQLPDDWQFVPPLQFLAKRLDGKTTWKDDPHLKCKDLTRGQALCPVAIVTVQVRAGVPFAKDNLCIVQLAENSV